VFGDGERDRVVFSRHARMRRFRSRRFCDNAAGPAGANVKRITRVLLHLRYCSAQPVVGWRGLRQ